jgi:single-strand DNA-binding protein
MGMATNRVWRDKNGARQEDTQYHNVVVFGSQAENVSQYMKKGNSLLIEGRLQTRSWDDKDGKKQYRTEIVADRVQFGPKGGAAPTGSPATAAGTGEAPRETVKTIEYPEEDINPDDIPF